MSKPTDIRIVEAILSFESVPYRTPLKFGGRTVDHAILVNVEVSAESRRGHGASGFGTMPLGSAWAWPANVLSVEQTEDAMQKFADTRSRLPISFRPSIRILPRRSLND
jgi:hypothetical protein